jgi:hypothetical protein
MHTAPDHAPARPGGVDAVTALAGRAGRVARRHQYELLILAGTVGFVLVVGLLALAALAG